MYIHIPLHSHSGGYTPPFIYLTVKIKIKKPTPRSVTYKILGSDKVIIGE